MNQTYTQILYFAAGMALVFLGMGKLSSRSLGKSFPALVAIGLGLFVVGTTANVLRKLL